MTSADNLASCVRWLRISYWVGAITDLIAAVAMIFPDLGSALYGLKDFTPGSEYFYAMDAAAALMLGWTALLLWADRSPLERRGILVLTVCPVILGLVIGEIVAVHNGFLSLANVIPTFCMQAALSALFLYSYARAASMARVSAPRGP